MTIFIIEDESHDEWCGEFTSYEDALKELKARANLPWDTAPNQCPCMNWKTCSRNYEIIEFDNSKDGHWKVMSRTPIFEISSKGVIWNPNLHNL